MKTSYVSYRSLFREYRFYPGLARARILERRSFNAPTCRVKAVTVERTFCEKATILRQKANRPEDEQIPSRYSRHYYDVYRRVKLDFHEAAIRQISLLEQVVVI